MRAGADFTRGIVPAVISTGAIARDRARIEQSGWDFANFRKNPVVLEGHNDGAHPIGTSSDEATDGDTTVAVAHFDMPDDRARALLGKIERGVISATSVRWMPLKTRVDKARDSEGKEFNLLVFERQELLEWSFVTVPADPGAVVQRADGGPLSLADYTTSELMQALERAQELLETAELSEAEQDTAARLYSAIAARVTRVPTLPGTAQDEISETLNALTVALRGVAQAVTEMRSRRSPDTQALVAQAVAQATGRSLESVQAQMRSV